VQVLSVTPDLSGLARFTVRCIRADGEMAFAWGSFVSAYWNLLSLFLNDTAVGDASKREISCSFNAGSVGSATSDFVERVRAMLGKGNELTTSVIAAVCRSTRVASEGGELSMLERARFSCFHATNETRRRHQGQMAAQSTFHSSRRARSHDHDLLLVHMTL
jgi:hypothetical protein